jgi:hypothetical protein
MNKTNDKKSHPIYELKLFERWAPSNNEMVTRVPGGWIYGDMQGCCFVPFNDEFQEAPNEPNRS